MEKSVSDILKSLRQGTLEYYSKHISILIQWDGGKSFDFIVQRNRDKQVLEATTISASLADLEDESLGQIWDRAILEFTDLKNKYVAYCD